ncbi:MAG TPA: hypothetical protein VLH84_04390 [Patescibacteria group bacterium]|nr:hypothetical protein [Patescibacteria group bacterium]
MTEVLAAVAQTPQILRDIGSPYEVPLGPACPELVEAAGAIHDLALSTLVGEVPDPDAAARKLFANTDVWGLLDHHGHNAAGVAEVVGALDSLDTATGDENSWALRVLQGANNSGLTSSLRRLIHHGDPALLSILDRAVSVEPGSLTSEGPLMRWIQDLTTSRYGTIVAWRDPKVYAGLPAFLQRLVDRPYAVRVALEGEQAHLGRTYFKDDPAADARIKFRTAHAAQDDIFRDFLGMDDWQIAEMGVAFSQRTLITDGQGNTLSFDRGGGIDPDKWFTAMRRYAENYNYLGAERVRMLRHDWGIVNLDRYAPFQLERMCRLSEGDPELLELLRNNDVSVLLTDAFGDFNNAAAADIEALESGHDNLLFTEITHPIRLYRTFVMLKRRFGITASNIIASTHGLPTYMMFGSQGNETVGSYFGVGVTDDKDPSHRYVGEVFFDIRDINLARFWHEYTSPSRADGLRHVLLLACYQKRRGSDTHLSTQRALAASANLEDRLQVTAAYGTLYWEEGRNELMEGPHAMPAILDSVTRSNLGGFDMVTNQGLLRGSTELQ